MKHSKLVYIACALFIILGCVISYNVVTQKMTSAKKENCYSISDFSKVNIGMNYDTVVDLIGNPTGSEGFGIVWQTYNLTDGSYVKLLFAGENNNLSSIIIVDSIGREYVLEQEGK